MGILRVIAGASILAALGCGPAVAGQVSRGTICSLGQPNKAIVPPAKGGRVSDRTMVGQWPPSGLCGFNTQRCCDVDVKTTSEPQVATLKSQANSTRFIERVIIPFISCLSGVISHKPVSGP